MNNAKSKHRSFWLDQAMPGLRTEPELHGDARADVVIVGGGFCGMWTAHELKRRDPGLDVAIVERDFCGSGASGRNAGYVLSLWAKFMALRARFGQKEAIRICSASSQVVQEIGTFCQAKGIAADFRENGWLWGATCEPQNNGWRPLMEALSATNYAPFQIVDRDYFEGELGLSGFRAAVIERKSATVQPAKLALGLRAALLDQGVRIYERSPLEALGTGKDLKVVTPKGRIRADKIVLAMNAWAVRFPEIRRLIAVVAAEGAITKPCPEWLERTSWATGPAITDSRSMVTNYCATADGRVEIGKGGGLLGFGGNVGPGFEGEAFRVPLIYSEFCSAMPAGKELQVEKSWLGPIDRSFDGVPIVDLLGGDPRICYGVGFSGNGVGPTKLASKILVSIVTEQRDEWTSLGICRARVERFPPEPIKYIGGHLVKAAVQSKDVAEHEGRVPSLLTRWLASKMPASMIPNSRK